jgi:hypothetical protein
MLSTESGKWLDEKIDRDNIGFRSDSFIALRVAAENVMRLALLANYLNYSLLINGNIDGSKPPQYATDEL